MNSNTFQLGKWLVDPASNQVCFNEDIRHLEPRAMDVLVHLMNHPGKVIAPEELLRHHWTKHTAERQKISRVINQIRAALDDDARHPIYIETISKRGYRIVASVSLATSYEQKVYPEPPTGLRQSVSDVAAGVLLSDRDTRPDEFRDNHEAGLDAISVDNASAEALAHMGTHDYFENWIFNAVERLKQAVEQEPGNAGSWSYLALLDALRNTRDGKSNFKFCVESAHKALSLNSQLGLPHVALGYAALLADWDLASARYEFERALEYEPNEPVALAAYHLLLRVTEELDLAEAIAERLRLAAPTDIRFRTELGKCHYETRLYKKAVTASQEAKTIIPGYVDFSEASSLHALGRFTDSYETRLAAYRLLGSAGQERASVLESGWRSGGYIRALQSLSDFQLTHDTGTEGLTPREFLILPDRVDQLFQVLKRDIEAGRPAMIGLLHNPEFDVLRVYPEFNSLLDVVMPNRPAESHAKQADVARVRIFRGESSNALVTLQHVLTEHSQDQRASDWLESTAWAYFSLGEYASAISAVHSVLSREDTSCHLRSRLHLLECASLVEESRIKQATSAYEAALNSWPGELELDKDIEPLFFGGDQAFKARFITAIDKASTQSAVH